GPYTDGRMGHSGRCNWSDLRNAGAYAVVPARSAAGNEHYGICAGLSFGHARSASGTVFGFPEPALTAYFIPTFAEPGLKPSNFAARKRRRFRRRACDR